MKEKRFCGLKKRNFLTEKDKVYYIRDRSTVCVLTVKIPIEKIIPALSMFMYDIIRKRFPEAKLDCGDYGFGTVFTVKGKAFCAYSDAYDEAYGMTIAYSKAQAKAYSIATRVYAALSDKLLDWANKAVSVSEFLEGTYNREINFLSTIC